MVLKEFGQRAIAARGPSYIGCQKMGWEECGRRFPAAMAIFENILISEKLISMETKSFQ